MDSRTGLLEFLDERDWPQFPQWVCEAGLSDPFGLLPAWAPVPTVVGHGLDRDEARTEVLLAALAGYASLAVDHRRLLPDRNGTAEWGWDPISGAPRPIPAELAFPALVAEGSAYRPPTGAAAGPSWQEALSEGTRQHCAVLLEQRLADFEGPLPRLDVPGFPLNERADHLRRLLGEVGEPAVAHDLTGLLSIPACALRVGADTVLAVGSTLTAALGEALDRGLLAWQARTEDRPDCAPHTVPGIPAEQETSPEASRPKSTGTPPSARALRALGFTPVVIALDHDPEAARILPYLVQVVILDE
ncbi:hypothetical protein FHX42_003800 [Saccharopolyspora lacisalsi]|uniref:YcaO domain-containing protein n=1 Tax=Halosaccharopolyspora lacisalsi TaxID=1000566 RepID=A0A839DY58_9PSEU|nr:hypothetical protein [Halosaccharopolyspora lacisalsi]MBA8826424.1 hypothetical protein [Halosaccharopolyspora lacisalsi]